MCRSTMSAFASVSTIISPVHRNSRTATCVCMKTKSGASNEKRAAKKSKRVSSNGMGFAKSSRNGEDRKEASKDTSIEGKVEDVSGGAGDATPHRVLVPGPNDMEDPQEDPLDAPTEPLVSLPALTQDEMKALRFDRGATQDELIDYLEEARRNGNFAASVAANRDFITENLLYRFTSAILQVEMRSTSIESRDEEARNMRELRKELISHCWSLDYSLKAEVQRAEVRLLEVLKGSNIKKDVKRNCGQNGLEVDAFWIVIFAAVAAWEERGRENPELVNVDMQESLAAAADACETVEAVIQFLSPALKAVQKILTSSDPSVQANVVSELDDNTIAQLGSFTEQIRLLPTPAYGALVRRLRSIVNYVLQDKYDIVPPVLDPFRFSLEPLERKSRLVSFSKTSQKLKRDN